MIDKSFFASKDIRTPLNGHTDLELRRTFRGKTNALPPQVGIMTHSYPYVTVLYRLNADSDEKGKRPKNLILPTPCQNAIPSAPEMNKNFILYTFFRGGRFPALRNQP